MIYLLILFICLLLPGCFTSMQTQKAYQSLQKKTLARTGSTTQWKKRVETLYDPPVVEEGMSVAYCVDFALKHNTEIQAAFEELGISSADLLQAGLYTNPLWYSAYEFPLKKNEQLLITIDFNLIISDLWQVPFRKKIAQDELEIKILNLLQLMLDTVRSTKVAYFDCLYHKLRYKEVKKITNAVNEWLAHIKERKLFGFTNDYDIYFANVRAAEWEVNFIEARKGVTRSQIALRDIMSLPINLDTVQLTEDFYHLPKLPNRETLLTFALKNKPELIIQRKKMELAQHELSYQKSRIVDDVLLGFAYDQDAEGDKNLGPTFGIRIPIFNWNTGNIKRAEYQYTHAEKRALSVEQDISKELLRLSVNYNSTLEQVELIKKCIIPNAHAGTNYAQHYFETMQMTSIVLLESEIALYKTELDYLDTILSAHGAYAELERVVSQQLGNISDGNYHESLM